MNIILRILGIFFLIGFIGISLVGWFFIIQLVHNAVEEIKIHLEARRKPVKKRRPK